MNLLRRRGVRRALVAGSAAVLAVTLVGPSPASASHRSNQIGAFDYGYAAIPDNVSTGGYHFNFVNFGDEPHEIVVFKLAPGFEDLTEEELVAAADAEDFSVISGLAGFSYAPPGDSHPGSIRFREAGAYAYFCFIETAEGVPHYQLGMVGKIEAG